MNRYNEELAQGRRAARARRPAARGARGVSALRRHRRPVQRGQGAGRRLLDHPGQGPRGGRRVGQARPEGAGSFIEVRQIYELADFPEDIQDAAQLSRGAAAPDRRRDGPGGDTARDRGGLADRVAAPDRRPGADDARRRRRRGSRAGRARRRPGEVAAVGRPGEPGRLADDRRQAPRDRPHAPLAQARRTSTREIGFFMARLRAGRRGRRSATTCSSLIFTCCHPVLSMEARVALTLRMLGGLSTPEIARAFLVPEATVAQRIVRAKKALAGRAVRGARAATSWRRGWPACSRSST